VSQFTKNLSEIFQFIIGEKAFREVSFFNQSGKFFSLKIKRWQFNKKRQAAFLSVFAELMNVGRLPFDIADYLSKYGQKIEIEIASDIKKNLSEGLSVTDSLDGWFDSLNLAALKAGESSGHEGFIRSLRHVSNSILEQDKISSSSYAKCLYPGVYALLSTVFIAAVYIAFVPILEEISGDGPLAPEVQNFKNFVEFWILWGLPILVLIVSVVFGFKYFEKNLVGETRDRLEMIKIGPWHPFGGYRLKIGSHIVSSFALLKRFDFPAFTIYRILSNEGSTYQKHHISIMQSQLKDGQSNEISSLDSGLLEPQYISLLSLYAGANQSTYVDALNSAASDIKHRCVDRMKINGAIFSYFLWGVCINNLAELINVLMSVNVS
jgi:type II secretory pathway component PulF